MRSSFGVKDEDSGSDLDMEDLKDGCALVIGLSGDPRSFSTAEVESFLFTQVNLHEGKFNFFK